MPLPHQSGKGKLAQATEGPSGGAGGRVGDGAGVSELCPSVQDDRLKRGTEGSSLALWDPGGALIPHGPVLSVETQANPASSSGWGFGRPGVFRYLRLKYCPPYFQLPTPIQGVRWGWL